MLTVQRAAGLAITMVLALSVAPGSGQVPEEAAPPRSVREAYERAMEFEEEHPPAPPAETHPHAEEPHVGSVWYDPVHYVGVGGGVLLLAALGTVLLLRLTARRRGKTAAARRRAFRSLHMFLGMTAAGLGVAHAGLRFWQLGEIELSPGGPMLIVYALVVLAVSGVLRASPPRAWSRHWRLFNWAHWLSAALVLAVLVLHVVETYRIFGPGS